MKEPVRTRSTVAVLSEIAFGANVGFLVSEHAGLIIMEDVMNSKPRTTPHFQVASGHYWILSPSSPIPAGGAAVPDWDQGYREILQELICSHAYDRAKAQQRMEQLGVATNGVHQDAQLLESVLAQRHQFRLAKLQPIGGHGGVPPSTQKPQERQSEDESWTPLPRPKNPYQPAALLSGVLTAGSGSASSMIIDELSWSQPQAHVNEPISCQFIASEVQSPKKVRVEIFQEGAGLSQSIAQFDYSIRQSGLQKAPWALPQSATSPILKPVAEGMGMEPTRFRFRINHDSGQTRLSDPLLMLRDLCVSVTDENGVSVADGFAVALAAADGQQHYAQTSDGKVEFKDVVLGPCSLTTDTLEHCCRSEA